jgi:NADPH2:quinone reductase
MLALARDSRRSLKVALHDVPEPEPTADEAIVEVKASTINRGELALLTARPDGWRPGQDVAGIVVEPARNGGPPAGSHVIGLLEQAAWSERVAAPIERLAMIDEKVTFEAGATLGLAGLTALRSVRRLGSLLGRTVLVQGAAGGLGHLVVQLAGTAGADVTALARTAARAERLRAIGAQNALVAAAPEDRFDVVVDVVGGASLEAAVRVIKPGGTIMLLGATDPEPARLTLLDFIGHEGARVLTHFSYAGDSKAIGTDLATLARFVANGRLRPIIDVAATWQNVSQLIRAMEHGDVAGKGVLVIGQSDDQPTALV